MYFTNVDMHLIKNDNVRWNVAYRDPGIVTCTCQNFSAYNVLFSSIYFLADRKWVSVVMRSECQQQQTNLTG